MNCYNVIYTLARSLALSRFVSIYPSFRYTQPCERELYQIVRHMSERFLVWFGFVLFCSLSLLSCDCSCVCIQMKEKEAHAHEILTKFYFAFVIHTRAFNTLNQIVYECVVSHLCAWCASECMVIL